MTVSVIIPTQNTRPGMLAEAIESVEKQTVKPIEILIESIGKNGWEKMNVGVGKSKGDCFIILSDDDKLDPTYIEKTVALMTKTSADIIATPLECFGDEIGVHGVGQFPFFTALCRKSIWTKAGGWDDIGPSSDADFWYKCFELGGRMEILGEPLFKYRKHAGQESKKITDQEWADTNKLVYERHGRN